MSSDESKGPRGAIDGSDVKADVFLELVDSKEQLTPSDLGDRIGESRQSVMYHLDSLVESGLVIRDDGEYYAQPMFVDPSFEDEITEAVGELAPKAEELVYIDPDVPEDEKSLVLLNCLETSIGMWLFEERE